jgi:putative flippase GtrA
MYAYIAGLSINIMFNFNYHRNITFKVFDKKEKRFTYFIVFTFIITCTNWLIVYIATQIYSFDYIISIIVVTLTLSIVNYLANEFLIFKNNLLKN